MSGGCFVGVIGPRTSNLRSKFGPCKKALLACFGVKWGWEQGLGWTGVTPAPAVDSPAFCLLALLFKV